MPAAYSQAGSVGAVSVTVTDPAGASVPDATLQLKDLDTNVALKGNTQANGTFSFPYVAYGHYELTVSKTGFQNQVFSNIQVQTGRTTDIKAMLQLGTTQQTVTVEGESPLVETDNSVIANTIDTKQVVNLPLQGRNMFSLALLTPGWASTGVTTGGISTAGTFDNLPGGAIGGAEFDGTQAMSNRFRSGGFTYGTSVVQPRIEDVAEMTIQTAQLDLSGNGVSAMRIALVTRRGSNEFHGRLFEDFQNTNLNANAWINNARNLPRNIVKLNDFGGSIGGPILKNKLFFFGTYAAVDSTAEHYRQRQRVEPRRAERHLPVQSLQRKHSERERTADRHRGGRTGSGQFEHRRPVQPDQRGLERGRSFAHLRPQHFHAQLAVRRPKNHLLSGDAFRL